MDILVVSSLGLLQTELLYIFFLNNNDYRKYEQSISPMKVVGGKRTMKYDRTAEQDQQVC